MIKAIIFDWGGVLIENPYEELMDFCAKYLNIKTEELKRLHSSYEPEYQKGNLLENEMWEKICNQLNVDSPKINSLWKEAVKKVFKDQPKTYELVISLKKNGYSVGFLSNTEISAMEYFFENGYEKYFDATTFSCAEHTIKPEEEIYLLTLKKLKVEPREAIFIDDKIKYVEGAKKCGMSGICFTSFDQLVKELKALSVKVNN